jgi:hypothetical protein
MPFDYSSLPGATRILDSSRAASLWRIISRDPRSIVLTRNGTELAVQTVRIEHDNSTRVVDTPIGRVNVQSVKVYGVVNHETVADTDIQTGDRFWLDAGTAQPKSEYEVRQVIRLPGQIQALADRLE